MKRTIATVVALWMGLCVQAADLPSQPSYLSYEGTAVDPDELTVLYTEAHFLAMDGPTVLERLVLYRCADGTPFARKRVAPSAQSPWLPEFAMEDARLGYREGLLTSGSELSVYVREDADSDTEREALLDTPEDLVGDAGFDRFVQDHWDLLVAGDTVRFHFLVPSRLDYMGFKVRQVDQTQIDGRPVRVFRLALGGLLGLIVSGIDVAYDADTRMLLRFEGLSNVRDAQGDNYVARIDFPPAARRIEADNAALEAARSVPLARACAAP